MDISYIPLKNDFEKKTYRAAESNKHLWLLIFIEFLALCAKTIWCRCYNRTAWVTAAASGFLNNWATTFGSGDSAWKCRHNRDWQGVSGVAPLCVLIVGLPRTGPVPVQHTWTQEKSLILQQEMAVSCVFLFVWCKKGWVAVFITRSVLGGWLIRGRNTNPRCQVFQIFVWQGATQQQLL